MEENLPIFNTLALFMLCVEIFIKTSLSFPHINEY